MSDVKTTWWIWRHVQTRLIKWALALLKGRRYRIILEPEGSGYHAPVERIIQANPQMFPTEPVEVQFRATQGILAHEVGHAWFTGNWPEQDEGALQEVVNALEDERVERAICTLYPGIAPSIQLLGDLVYAGIHSWRGRPAEQALDCCLAWRWASARTGEAEMFDRLGLSPAGRELWSKVRPLVESAWLAPDTGRVIAVGREILDILGLPPSTPQRKLCPMTGSKGGHIPREGARPLPLPSGPADQSPGLGKDLDETSLPEPASARKLEPAPYVELEERMRPAAARLAEALQEPKPEVHLRPHEYRGRYSFRQEIRTPETPHLARQGTSRAPRSLALYVLVDRSGSMGRFEGAVREALMTIYLAATQLAIPIGMACFGEDLERPVPLVSVDDVVVELAPVSTGASELAKALIAGYGGWSGNEYLDWGLRKAEAELQARMERLRVILVIHDGEPVFKWRGVTDWDLSLSHLMALERKGIVPIGVFLGTEEDELAKMHKLFNRLVACKGEQLPEKLGDLLRSLA